jgi:hypothetical protein
MNMNLVGIAGVPPQDMSGKLVGVGGCGCAAMNGYARPVGETDAPSTASKIVPVLVLTAVVGIAVWSIFRMETSTA